MKIGTTDSHLSHLAYSGIVQGQAIRLTSFRVKQRRCRSASPSILGARSAIDYVITSDRRFDQIEAQTLDALEKQGFSVQRTFSLRSAAGAKGNNATSSPGYSVLMLHTAGIQRQPLGHLHLFEQEGRIVIRPDLTAVDHVLTGAALVIALVLCGLDLCATASEVEECIELGQAVGGQV